MPLGFGVVEVAEPVVYLCTYYTGMVSDMNIMLSAKAELIRKGREYAKLNGTSLRNGKSVICSPEKMADKFVCLAKSLSGKSEHHFRFSRDDLYDRHKG